MLTFTGVPLTLLTGPRTVSVERPDSELLLESWRILALALLVLVLVVLPAELVVLASFLLVLPRSVMLAHSSLSYTSHGQDLVNNLGAFPHSLLFSLLALLLLAYSDMDGGAV